jgi:toxin ParE1/3/4
VSGKFRYSYSKRALRDIAHIYTYIAQDNPKAAERFMAALEAKIITLATAGVSGVSREWLMDGLRAFTFRDRCIYFQIDAGEMKILRILHARQNISAEMFSPSEE